MPVAASINAKKLTPCLWFDQQAEAAVQFYCSVFADSEILETVNFNAAGPGEPGSVMLIRFRLQDEILIALNGGPHYQPTPAFSLSISCRDQGEVDYYWEALTANGGEPGQCGWLLDQFGVSWQVVPAVLEELIRDSQSTATARAMQSIFSMQKINIETVLRATVNADTDEATR